VDKDGSIIEPKRLRSVEDSKSFDTEVLRAVELMPIWIPEEQKGEKVRVFYNLPINFS
jgi:hypothetical protein